ncbi:Oxidoreductase-like domain-containing protein [Meloidogyne graminicola]|uniref:Oxidoreductase-like domain-containing protein n=1 Tax=Meloidogyne graminicola TaxID=189291 RepID=A0A8S9ZV95_9BILA|nr:Oxidoreductase-like domain-containing protein [Meloidogyne graminicola]
MFYNFTTTTTLIKPKHLFIKTINIILKCSYKQHISLIGPIAQPIDQSIQSTSKLTQDETKEKSKKTQHFAKAAKFPLPPQPGQCCGSGCPNCVWLQYVDNVLDYVKSLPLDEKIIEEQKRHIREELKNNVEDDNLRMFLTMEIEAKGL